MTKAFILIASLLFFYQSTFAQRPDNSANLKRLNNYQDSLKDLGHTFINDTDDMARKNAGYRFIKTLVNALKTPNSFSYPFDSVQSISILNSPDKRFRIFSWHVINDDGSYRFYGAVQLNSENLKLYGLEDYSPLLKNPEDSITDTHKWYGAQYYTIVPVNATRPYYVLLGWKGNTVKSTKRVIEVIALQNDKIQFGLPVFFGNGKTRKRVIFEYTRQASMHLKYIPSQNLIVFDHLSAPDTRSKNKPETFGPDMTYDGYKLQDGQWTYVENLDMRNVANEHDEDYIDPRGNTTTPAKSNQKK